jgi:hypothetical protein
LVDRRREIELLTAGLDAAIAGRGRLYLVSGTLGIGKSRLLGEVGAIAAQRHTIVLQSALGTADSALGLAGWVSIVRPLLEHPLAATVDEHVRIETVRAVARAAAGTETRKTAVGADAAYERFVLIDALTSFLHAVAWAQPLVLLFDDLETATLPSLLALELLARDLDLTRILVVGAYRDGLPERMGHLIGRLGNLARYSTAIPLSELDFSSSRELIAERTGKEPSLPLASLMHDATGGNPFFLDEVLKQFTLYERWSPELVTVPDRVRDSVRAWRDSLPPESQLVLESAAVVGRVFDPELLALTHDIGASEVLAALSPATTAGLVQPTATGAFRFRQGLTRETIYADVAAERRRILHDAIGLALELRHAGRHDGVLPALAHHFSAGQLESNRPRARIYLRRAGEQALHLYAYAQAATYFERALALLDPAGDAPERERAELQLLLARAALRAGEIERGNQAARAAAAEARRLDSIKLLAHAGLTLRRADSPHADVELLALLEEARVGLGANDRALGARIDAQLARELALGGDWQRADALSRSALSIARELDDQSTLAATVASRCKTLGTPSQEEERLALSAELLDRAQRIGDRELALEAGRCRVADFLALADGVALDAEIRAAHRLSESIRQPYYLWWSRLWRSMRATLAGDFGRGKRCATEAHALGDRVRPRTARIALMLQTIVRLWQQGDVARLLALVEGFAAEHGGAYPECKVGRIWALAGVGRRVDALRELSALAAADYGGVPVTQWRGVVVALLAETAGMLENATYAAPLYERLRPYAGRVLVLGSALDCLGPADRYLGILATLRREWDAAEAHFARSLELSRRLAAAPFIARTQHNHAAMLHARGRDADCSRAELMLAEALTAARKLGMAKVAHEVEAIQVRLAATVSARAATAGADEASPSLAREGEHWTFRYGGMVLRVRHRVGLDYLAVLLERTNQEIAAVALIAAVGTDPSVPLSMGQSVAGGRQRADPARTRARVRVTRAVREAIKRINTVDAQLGEHLTYSVRTGNFCCYAPPDRSRWTIVR